MIRMGGYDAFDKWELVCRAWAGEQIDDVGADRQGRPALAQWQIAAFEGGRAYCLGDQRRSIGWLLADHDYVRLRGLEAQREAITRFVDGIPDGGPSDLEPQLAARLREVFKAGALMALRWTDDPGEIPSIMELRWR